MGKKVGRKAPMTVNFHLTFVYLMFKCVATVQSDYHEKFLYIDLTKNEIGWLLIRF